MSDLAHPATQPYKQGAKVPWRAGGTSERKARLFAAQCAERVKGLMGTARLRHLVADAMAHADGELSKDELNSLAYAAADDIDGYQTAEGLLDADGASVPGATASYWQLARIVAGRAATACALHSAMTAARDAPVHAATAMALGKLLDPSAAGLSPSAREEARAEHIAEEKRQQLRIVDDVFYHRPMPDFVSQADAEQARQIALHCYHGHWDSMAVLSDLVEECGVGIIADLTAHLRVPGPHYRGCWALDSILGRH
jgi:hypothetical protein